MRTRTYRWNISGVDANLNAYHTSGVANHDTDRHLLEVMAQALQESFEQLTEGRAQFGKPGVGCKGPYTIIAMTFVSTEHIPLLEDKA